MLIDVVLFIGGGQDLALIDVVDAQRLEDLRLDKVPDTALRHHRDGDGLDDGGDQPRVAHPGHAAFSTDVGRHPLERHDGHRARVLGDLRLLGGDDVHDDAAFEHLGQPGFDLPGASPVVQLGCCLGHDLILLRMPGNSVRIRGRPVPNPSRLRVHHPARR